ncbi:MAG: TIGR00159 family protein [Candidatus Eremiobacteraeota bacterium]|nr:TIGR00159 family protein [Candidatus Eremiobacteraeota bacterium]MBV8374874.1 TIGR00159 family protein [Candidatus Eremiobacteraeota bacterium]
MLHQLLSYVGVADVIDILATSILIYYLILLIRGTRAVQILLGILVLVGLLGIANVLHLSLLRTILQLIVVGAAVALPIVFQPELRRALEQIGRGGLFRIGVETSLTRTEDRSIAALAGAAFLLARGKAGALIVIEQQTGLKEWCDTGTALHAQLSPELLLAIFMPRSPLHDGAAIVRENQIEAAGCFLPLAEQTLSGNRLGTRHRAALGLSEQTDAVVIVVSEETGAITIARDGKLSRPVEEEGRLIKMLLAVTRPMRRERRARPDLISHLRSRLTAPRTRKDPRADRTQELRT